MGVGIIVSMVAGGLLAIGAGFGLVNAAAGSAPQPVNAEYVVYGES